MENVESGLLDSGRALLDVNDVEDENPGNDDVINKLCKRTSCPLGTAAKVGSLKRRLEMCNKE